VGRDVYLLTPRFPFPMSRAVGTATAQASYGGATLFVVARRWAASRRSSSSCDRREWETDVFREQGSRGGMVIGTLFRLSAHLAPRFERGPLRDVRRAVGASRRSSVDGRRLVRTRASLRACFYVNLPFGLNAVARFYFELPHMSRAAAAAWTGPDSLTLIGGSFRCACADVGTLVRRRQPRASMSVLSYSTVDACAMIYAESRAGGSDHPVEFPPAVIACARSGVRARVGMFERVFICRCSSRASRVSATQYGN